jgi:hypothetical protein
MKFGFRVIIRRSFYISLCQPRIGQLAWRHKRMPSGPIRLKALSPELLEQIGIIYGVLGRYLGMKLEGFENSLIQQATPDSSVTIWSRVAADWEDYHEKHLGGMVRPDAEEKRIIEALIAISAGETDAGKLPVRPVVGTLLLASYSRLSRP